MEELGSMSTDKSKNRSSLAETDSQLKQRVTLVITPYNKIIHYIIHIRPEI